MVFPGLLSDMRIYAICSDEVYACCDFLSGSRNWPRLGFPFRKKINRSAMFDATSIAKSPMKS